MRSTWRGPASLQNRPAPPSLPARRRVGSRTVAPGFLRLGSLIVDQVKLAYQLTRKAGGEGKAGRGEDG